MLLSMTGFVTHTFDLTIGKDIISLTMQLKTLNGRFFETNCRLPHALTYLEPLIIKKLKERLYRGTVYVGLYPSSPLALSSTAQPSWPTIDAYVTAAKAITDAYGPKVAMKTELDINTLLQLPHVIDFAEFPVDPTVSEIILNHIDTQIDLLIKERAKEGRELQTDLEKRFAKIQTLTDHIKIRARAVFEERRAKLVQEFEGLLAQAQIESRENQVQMVYAQLEKLDITEEIVRLNAHIENARNCITSEGAEKGKKLDFILQEMFREINTIGSKCADSEIASFAITVKVELEKAREQTQNIV
jgi:uncharacterized protein (TIGR00255 family)